MLKREIISFITDLENFWAELRSRRHSLGKEARAKSKSVQGDWIFKRKQHFGLNGPYSARWEGWAWRKWATIIWSSWQKDEIFAGNQQQESQKHSIIDTAGSRDFRQWDPTDIVFGLSILFTFEDKVNVGGRVSIGNQLGKVRPWCV